MSPREYLGFLRRAWAMFRSAEKVWRLPGRARLLIVDRNTAYPLDEIFAHHSPHIMDIRGESINLAVVLRAIPKFRLGALAYLEAYIDAVAPTLILSRTDNNPMLWQLKRRPSSPYTVALIQNGSRTAHPLSSPITTQLRGKGDICDLVFGKASAIFARANRRSTPKVVGSVLANRIPRHDPRGHPDSRTMSVISTFRPKEPMLQIAQRSTYATLVRLARDRGLRLRILMNSRSDTESWRDERQYWKSICGEHGIMLIARPDRGGSYGALPGSRLVISGHSTLGYEALALGYRTGIILPTSEVFNGRDLVALGLPARGACWSRTDDEAEIERILDYLLTVSDEQWEKDSGWIRDQLIVHDYGNTKLKRYVEGVLAGKGDVLAEEERAEAARSGGRPGEGLGERG